jgi:hypothetical protein
MPDSVYGIRPTGATPTVGVQLNLRETANTPPLLLHHPSHLRSGITVETR